MLIKCIAISELASFTPAEAQDKNLGALITLLDPEIPPPATPSWATQHLHLAFCDLDEVTPEFLEPQVDHARAILDFHQGLEKSQGLVVACQAGAGRSHAVLAALLKLAGHDP